MRVMRDRPLETARLVLRRLTSRDTGALHALAVDAHIRRYLLDGEEVERAWADDEVTRSDELFASHGVGVALVHEVAAPETPIGFAGFREFEEVPGGPQLLYALTREHTGRGYATELAEALVAEARRAGMSTVVSAVDAPNVASLRVLEKCGFQRTGTCPGAFGEIVLLALRPTR
jgi:RimJ/RimL family protein N-acetyltransferase